MLKVKSYHKVGLKNKIGSDLVKKQQKARKVSRQIGLETAVMPETSSAEKPKSRILKEITDKREKNVKHFLKDDLTFEAAVYNEPVHYFS